MRPDRDASALIEVAAAARDVEEYERGALEILERRVGFDVAIFRHPDRVGSFRIDPKVDLDCRPHWPQFKRDIAPIAQVALARGVAVDVDVLGMRRLERLSYYQRLMRPHRGTSTAIVCLTRRGEPFATLALGRTRGTFDDRELDHLRVLVPALSVCEAAVLAPAQAAVVELPLSAALTAREREVLAHLPLGHTNRQIALALGTAERTVRNQLSSIYEKLGVGSRAEAVAVCLGRRLLP